MLPTHIDAPATAPAAEPKLPASEPGTVVPEPGTREAGSVRGPVQYRLGDGPTLTLPPGPIEVERGQGDVTISWHAGRNSQATAMPATDFARFVKEGAIVLDAVQRPSSEAAGQKPPKAG